METNIWTFSREYATEPLDVEGFKVEARDGDIGKVDEATYEVGSSYIVVDTGPWILGRKVVLPAASLERIDIENRKVAVSPHQGPDQGLSRAGRRGGLPFGGLPDESRRLLRPVPLSRLGPGDLRDEGHLH